MYRWTHQETNDRDRHYLEQKAGDNWIILCIVTKYKTSNWYVIGNMSLVDDREYHGLRRSVALSELVAEAEMFFTSQEGY